jgi:signal transduction histidine kinase
LRVRYTVLLLAVAFVVALTGAIVTIHAVNRMFVQLRWQTSELARLSSRALADQEQTARRFSRELHDHMGQTLSALEANLVAVRQAREYRSARVEDCLALVKDAIDNVREVSQLLRPSILDDFGLDAALRWLADSFAERTGIRVDYKSGFSGRLAEETETQLFRIAQEALTNVARHSGASCVEMSFAQTDHTVSLTIADNGRGLAPSARTGGLGLIGMRARARAAHGTLRVESRPNKGVSISVVLRDAAKDSNLAG